MVMFLRGARVKYFSAASRPDACFLLVATPPLKVFRQPCTVTQVCTVARLVLGPTIAECPL